MVAQVRAALRGFGHPGAFREIVWDITRSAAARGRLPSLPPDRRPLVARAIDRYDAIHHALPGLQHAVLHGDLNDWNLLIDPSSGAVSGVLDVGDAVFGPAIADLAIAMTYAGMGASSPLLAWSAMVEGYRSVAPIPHDEIAVLPGLIAGRLATSLTVAAVRRASSAASDDYWFVSERQAWELLEALDRLHPEHLIGSLRCAARLDASPRFQAFRRLMDVAQPAPILELPLERLRLRSLSWASPSDPMVRATSAGDLGQADAAYESLQRTEGFDVAIGRWGERRAVYQANAFESYLIPGARRDTHLGLDVFAPAGTRLRSPLPARVVATANCNRPQDYGGVVLLAHELEPGEEFCTLWGHLDPASIQNLTPGTRVEPGVPFASLGDARVNGGWVPHLHLQIVLTGERDPEGVIGVGESDLTHLWAGLYPDPSPLAGIPPEVLAWNPSDSTAVKDRRAAHLGPNLRLSYRTPLEVVRGRDVWLYTAQGRAYLDCYNNVAHVGHEHPAVVAAIARQAGILNTNTRYLNRLIGEYAERLTATFPPGLDTVYFTNSGSEANELALRIARTLTGRRPVAVLDWAYHGNTQSAIDCSPYKYKRQGGTGRPASTIELPCPDTYRAPADWPADQVGLRYAEFLEAVVAAGEMPAAFLHETIPSCAGQIVLPPRFLARTYDVTRAAGGLCIADEVQVGFGRVGTAMWAFEEHGVTPDIVTLGKPIGNGHPLGAVVTTRAIARQFANGMEYFNTFGGNPVSAATGLAVLQTLQDGDLVANALRSGERLMEALRALQARVPAIGDVRGRGLFLGIDLVADRASREPDTALAARVVQRCLDHGVLLGTDGPLDNVLKIRPPMTIRPEHEAILLEAISAALEA